MKHVLRLIFIIAFIFSFSISLPSMAQSEQQKILIGILPEINIFKQKQRFKVLGEYLSKKSGLKVEFTIMSRYGNIIDQFTAEKMDGAFFGSFTGALAIKKMGVIPLVRPVNLDGTSTYQGYLFTRRDSGIKGVKDMKNKKMAYVAKATTAGYIFPLVYLKDNGIRDTDHFFSETFFAGSHDAAIAAVLNGKADVGAAKNTVYNRERLREPRVDTELIILAESIAVPSNGFCVRSGLDESIRNKIKSVLLALHSDPDGKAVLQQFGALKFIEATAGDYQSVLEMTKKAGIDLMTYNYIN